MSAERIAALNDAHRRSMPSGQVVFTRGVASLPTDVLAMAIRMTATFNQFNGDNDPHGEHDFGSFELSGHKFFWKIDYYDKEMKYGSEDPADPEVTTRVLTLMFASDY